MLPALGWMAWWIGTPVKCVLWLGNRIATGFGLAAVWRRFRSRQWVWPTLILLNLLSLGGLAAVIYWVSHHR